MSRHLLTNCGRLLGLTGLAWGLFGSVAATLVRADVPLTRANVESLHRQVEILPRGRAARPARLSDRLGIGDALRTSTGARAELRFNDGSLARIGERATFRFVPNTRNFRLSNGTVLFLVPPGRGSTTIQTPSAVTGIQGTALIVRHVPFAQGNTSVSMIDRLSKEQVSDSSANDSEVSDGSWNEEHPGRTIVMVLTDSQVQVTAANGTRTTLEAGQMAVIEPDSINVVGFDLPLFYSTSPLLEGLQLGDPDFVGTGLPTDPVYQEVMAGLEVQDKFISGYLLNPEVLNGDAQIASSEEWFVSDEVLVAADGMSVSASSLSNTGASGGGGCGAGRSGLMAGGFANCVSPSGGSRTAVALDDLPAGLFGPVEDDKTASGSGSTNPTSPTPGGTPPTGGTSGNVGGADPLPSPVGNPTPITPPGTSTPNQPVEPINPAVPSVPAPTITPVGTPEPAPAPTPVVTPPGTVTTPSPTVVVSPTPTVPTPAVTPTVPTTTVTPPGSVAAPSQVNPTPANTPSSVPTNFTPPGLINTEGPVETMPSEGAN